jgi:hypothetical protein
MTEVLSEEGSDSSALGTEQEAQLLVEYMMMFICLIIVHLTTRLHSIQ